MTDNGNYQSGAFSPTRAGTYRWVAHYSGDVNNEPKSTSCDDPAEAVVVSRASPSLSSTASGPVHPERVRSGPAHKLRTAREHVARAPQPINDIAHLSDGFSPTGTITFSLYGPDSPTCSGDPLSTSSVTVHGNGDYNSDLFTPTRAGTYRWVVHYSGDDNNDSAGPTHCGIESETVVIEPARPTIFTVATPGAIHVDNPIADVASLDGGADPHGTITFHLYGPDDAGCTGTAAHNSTVDVHGNGSYTSSSFTPTQLGSYHWVAHYSGDGNNEPVSNACDDEREMVVVSPPPLHPTALTTTASPVAPATSPAGSSIHDTAHLTDGVDPTGRITFTLYGPNDPNCTGPSADIAPVTVAGNGNYRRRSHRPGWGVSMAGHLLRRYAQPRLRADRLSGRRREGRRFTGPSGADHQGIAQRVGRPRRARHRLPDRRLAADRDDHLPPLRPEQRRLLAGGRVHHHPEGHRQSGLSILDVHPTTGGHLPLGRTVLG